MNTELPEVVARTLVGPRADYYVSRWQEIDHGRRALGFHWPAFFAFPLWMLYRRMHRAFWLFVGTVLLSVVLEDTVLGAFGIEEMPRVVDHAITAVFATTAATFASYWYYLDLRRRYRALASAGTPDETSLSRIGGVSWVAVGVGVAAIVLVILFLALADEPTQPQ
jgi:hypothetical protein